MSYSSPIGLLDAAASADPDRPLLTGAACLTLGQVSDATHAIAAWLSARGVRGDRERRQAAA